MISLAEDLQTRKSNLQEFKNLTVRILEHLSNVLSSFEEKNNYKIYSSQIAGTTKYVRPINKNLFLDDKDSFLKYFNEFELILEKRKSVLRLTQKEKDVIDRITYTIQQAIGAGLDLLVNPNSARKHAGNRFEELIKAIFTELGIANKKIVLQIPYNTETGKKTYKCENDLILSPYSDVKSSSESLNENEIVISVKTTSKDRMGKMFIDKMLLERFVKHPQKVIGIFLNDVQRKEQNNISFTLVSGLFMVYTQFLTELEGVYYVDTPPNANVLPYSKYIKRFSDLISDDLDNLLTS